MCAIAGLLDVYYDQKIANQMIDTMRRRGPDSSGVYQSGQCCLMHTRLAIIDPQGGAQPMVLDWAGDQYVISYNGELYNTQQIRDELQKNGHNFAGHSDTEVLLHAFAQWGQSCLERLNGIYAFAVWQKKKKELFIARDRMGVKPFFYKLHNGGFIFASEMKTILKYPTVKAELDSEGVGQIILMGPGRIPGKGVFRDIFELEPGCCGVYKEGKLEVHRYWKLMDREHTESFDDTVAHVRYLVEDAITRQMVSDVPIGTFLSGGVDSSIISAICATRMCEDGKRLKTFSLDYLNNDIYFVPGKFQPNSDTEYIRIMERWLDSESHWTVLTPYDLVSVLEEATVARDLPGMADVDFSLLRFCGNIRSEVKVALSGECADEIFGGYPWYRDPAVRATQGFPWAQNTEYRAKFINPQLLTNLSPEEFVREQYLKTVLEADILPGTRLEERQTKEMVNLNLHWFMQTLLDRKDRMSMYHGLEVRVPFCDHRIAEYLYGVPWEMKEYGGMEKGLLRKAVEGLLPDDVLYRKKSPYPKTYDPRYTQMIAERFRELLEDNSAPIHQLINKGQLQNLLEGDVLWPWYGQLMKVPQTMAFMLQINFWLSFYGVSII